jgi:phosphoglycolate phosphatase
VTLILFDVDGTLVDSQNLIVAAQREAFQALGLEPPTRERSLSIVGLSLVEAFTTLAGARAPVAELAQAYRGAVHRMREEPEDCEPLYEGARELVAHLAGREGITLGIATGKPRRGVDHLLRRKRWHGVFATIQTADDAPSKPDPTMLRQAMGEVDAKPSATVMIGDTSFDMAMACAAGVRAIGVSWGYHPVAALREAGAEVVLDRLDQVPEALGPAVAPGVA